MIGFSLFGFMVDTSIERKNGLSQSVAPCPQLSLYESYTILSLLALPINIFYHFQQNICLNLFM